MKNGPAVVFGKLDKRQEILDSVNSVKTSETETAASSTMQSSIGSSTDAGEREVVRDSDEFVLGDSSGPKSVGVPELEPIRDATWRAVSLRDPTVKFAVSESSLSWRNPTDHMIDLEAYHAIDWKADSRSCHIEDPCCTRPCGSSYGDS